MWRRRLAGARLELPLSLPPHPRANENQASDYLPPLPFHMAKSQSPSLIPWWCSLVPHRNSTRLPRCTGRRITPWGSESAGRWCRIPLTYFCCSKVCQCSSDVQHLGKGQPHGYWDAPGRRLGAGYLKACQAALHDGHRRR